MENTNNDEIEQIEAETLKIPKRRNYVQTEARKLAFEKAREKRIENIKAKKLEKEKNEQVKEQEIKQKIIIKAEQIKKKSLKEKKIIEKYIEPESDSDSEPEIIIQKVKKSKPRKKSYCN